MSYKVIPFSSSSIKKQAISAVEKCNDLSAAYGLVLNRNEIVELVETRFNTLVANGRLEFGGGVIEILIREFSDSPFITLDNYAETLRELIEIFYFYKNETLDLVSDDVLIEFMKKNYNGACQGSLDLLSGRELANMARSLRYGENQVYPERYRPEDDGGDKDV